MGTAIPINSLREERGHSCLKGSCHYLNLVLQADEDGSGWKGAGAVIAPRRGLAQTTSIDSEQIIELKVLLEHITLTICDHIGGMENGQDGRIRIHMFGGAIDLRWDDSPPEALDPLFEWIDDVHHLIEEKAFDEEFANA